MKSRLLKTITILTAAALTFALPLRAEDDGDNDDGQRGGDVEGTESLEQKVVLAVTAAAPADATGKAKLEADDHEGTSAAVLKIETRGLVAGTYTVSTTSLADGTTVTVLGTFDAVDETEGEDGDDGDGDGTEDDLKSTFGVVQSNQDTDDDGDTDDDCDEDDDGDTHPTNDTQGDVEFGDEEGPAFPDGFNPLDIGLISITDANGVVVMTGDFSTLATTTAGAFKANVRITPGPLAAAASGHAAITAKVKNHHLKQAFVLAARGLPASTKLNIRINGTLAGQVTTSAAGKINLRKVPSGFSAHRVVSVSFENESGTRAASAHF